MDNLQIFKRNSELLLDLAKKYKDLNSKNGPKSEKRKLESYMESILKSIEKNIKENVEKSNQASQTTG
jgi:hypothetical protein